MLKVASGKFVKSKAVVETHLKLTAMTPLLADLRQLIVTARERVAVAVNAELTMLYWHIGQRIRREVLNEQRAEYGRRIVDSVAAELRAEFGSGFDRPNVFRMLQFAEQFSEEAIVVTLSRQLSWSHFLAIFPLRDDLARTFYAEMCRLERWSVRTLRERIDSMLYERTAISRKPADLIAQELSALSEADRLTPDLVFRDPYLLDFLGLTDAFSEKDLSEAILTTGLDSLYAGGTGTGRVTLAGFGQYSRRGIPDRAAAAYASGSQTCRGRAARARTNRASLSRYTPALMAGAPGTRVACSTRIPAPTPVLSRDFPATGRSVTDGQSH